MLSLKVYSGSWRWCFVFALLLAVLFSPNIHSCFICCIYPDKSIADMYVV